MSAEVGEKTAVYLVKYINRKITADELQELKKLLSAHPEEKEVFQKCLSMYKNHRQLEFLQHTDQDKAWYMLQQRCAKRRSLRIRKMWISAASVAIFIMIGWWGYDRFDQPAIPQLVQSEVVGKGKAMLTLSGGKQIVLGSQDRIIEKEGAILIKDSLSHLSYSPLNKNTNAIIYHELFVPRGGEYSLTLADGTKVWLNADSHLRFPVYFSGDIREVELSGEAYFEVVPDKSKPFIVKIGKNQVEVLGTHFNISAYAENDKIFTTLAQGSVKVSSLFDHVILKPGEQAGISKANQAITIRDVDASLYTSWRYGVYEFRNFPLYEIIIQLSRWYDVKMRFTSEILKNKRFTGAIKRDNSLVFTIENLEKISNLKFNKQGDEWLITD